MVLCPAVFFLDRVYGVGFTGFRVLGVYRAQEGIKRAWGLGCRASRNEIEQERCIWGIV